MKLRKLSITSSFVSVCWFSSLFAICLFSFLYLHPRDTDNCLNILKADSITSTKPGGAGVEVGKLNDSVIELKKNNQVTRNEEPAGYEVKSNDTVIGLKKSNQVTQNEEPTSVEVKSNDTVIGLKKSNQVTRNEEPTSVEVKSNDTVIGLKKSNQVTRNEEPANIELKKSNQVTRDEKPTSVEVKYNDTVIELKKSNQVTRNEADKIPRRIEEETDQDYDTIPSYDVFWNPPQNCSKEDRILWLKEKLEESKLIKSTSRTQYFDEKIQSFFNPKGNNDVTFCRVRIFLTWIYPASLFGKRELLVLESIIRAHPDGCIVILSRTMDSNPGRAVLRPILDRGCRVLTLAPDYHYLCNNTPAQGWLERLEAGEVDPGTVPITLNLSNLLRLVVLYKYGGVYFDNDMILLKPVSYLRNTIGIQSVDHQTGSWSIISNAVLIFDNYHPLLWKFMEEFAWNFDGFKWAYNGPDLATRVVSKTLNDSNFQFNLIVPLAFYPIDWVRINRLFEKTNKKNPNWAQNKFNEIIGESYGIHLWNRQTRDLKIEKKSVMDKLISNHCIICQNIYDS